MARLWIFILFLAPVQMGISQNLIELRSAYPAAVYDNEATLRLYGQLADLAATTSAELLAYQGAVETLRAKFEKKAAAKKEYFKDGVTKIERAVKDAPDNIEIRYLRLSVQENSPKFLGYHENIAEDKDFILDNYAKVAASDLKRVIKDYVQNSKNFSKAEIAVFE